MNKMLECGNGLDEQAVDTAKTAARRERHRKVLRQRYLQHMEPRSNPVPDVEVRNLYKVVKNATIPRDWSLMVAIAVGHTYREVASLFGSTPSAIGVRTFRARRTVREKLPPAVMAELTELLAA